MLVLLGAAFSILAFLHLILLAAVAALLAADQSLQKAARTSMISPRQYSGSAETEYF